MPKFLFVYHGGSMPETKEEGEAEMAKWGAWFAELGDAVIDGGNPVGKSTTVSAGKVKQHGGANPASGYSLINAADDSDAVAKAQGCPILARGGSVELAPVFEMG